MKTKAGKPDSSELEGELLPLEPVDNSENSDHAEIEQDISSVDKAATATDDATIGATVDVKNKKKKPPASGMEKSQFQWLKLHQAQIGEGTKEYQTILDFEQQQKSFSKHAREFIKQQQERKFLFELTRGSTQPAPIFATLSGKGGSGKTSFALSFCVYLASLGKRVLLVDFDFYTHGLSYYFSGSVEFDTKQRPHLTLDELVDKISQGQYSHQLLNNRERPVVIKIQKNPKSIRLADNLYVTLGKTQFDDESTGAGMYRYSRNFMLMESILEYVIKPVNYNDNVDIIFLDLGAGPFNESILSAITHPIFVTEGDKVSMKSIERLRANWVKARGFQNPCNAQDETTQQAMFKHMMDENQYYRPSMPFLLLNRVNQDNLAVVEKEILSKVKGYFVLPPLPYTGIFRESAATYEFVRYLATALPYSLQVLENIKTLLPGLLPVTTFEASYSRIFTLFKQSPMRGDPLQSIDFENTDEIRQLHEEFNLSFKHNPAQYWIEDEHKVLQEKWDARESDQDDNLTDGPALSEAIANPASEVVPTLQMPHTKIENGAKKTEISLQESSQ